MQTFLTEPTTDFAVTARTLDNKRLNKQALEAWQIMMTNLQLDPQGNFRRSRGWRNHPATRMWRGYEVTLFRYIDAMVTEWKCRGYKSTILDKAASTLNVAFANNLVTDRNVRPSWMSDVDVFSRIAESHRRALLVKDYGWYSQFGWVEDSGFQENDYEYVWGEAS